MKIRDVNIDESKSKNDIKKSGYYAVFGDEKIARLIRKVQSTVIRNGNELQTHILNNTTLKKYNYKDVTFENLYDTSKKTQKSLASMMNLTKNKHSK